MGLIEETYEYAERMRAEAEGREPDLKAADEAAKNHGKLVPPKGYNDPNDSHESMLEEQAFKESEPSLTHVVAGDAEKSPILLDRSRTDAPFPDDLLAQQIDDYKLQAGIDDSPVADDAEGGEDENNGSETNDDE